MKSRIKGISDEEAETIYAALTGGNGGLNKGAKVNDPGVKMLLDLRNEFSGSDNQTDRHQEICRHDLLR